MSRIIRFKSKVKKTIIIANKIKDKLILELRGAHMSQNSIAATRNMSKSSVSEVCKIADDKQIHFIDVKDLSDDEVYQRFFPKKVHESESAL